MQIKQLGNGGGLDILSTNSSFLINLYNDEYLLFDCGWNIMEKLLKVQEEDEDFHISKIKYVFISHDDDDHIGNLQTLIYYNYFINNVTMKIISKNTKVKHIISDINYIKQGGNIIDKDIVQLEAHSLFLHRGNIHYNISHVPAFHGNRECTGMLIKSDTVSSKAFNTIYISGDTTANYSIEEFLTEETDLFTDTTIVFHDFSNWNAPSKNVHACEGDFTVEYSKEFQEKCIKYHNNEEFNEDWVYPI